MELFTKSTAAIAMALMLSAGLALAQGAPRPEPLDIPDAPPSPPGRIEFELAPVAPAVWFPRSSVHVLGFRFSGQRSVPEAVLLEAVAAWTGRSLSGEQLMEVAAAVTARLRAAGLLVAQALIREQEVREGVVHVEILEGRIGQLLFEADEGTRLRRAVAERFVGGLRPGEVIRRDNLEQSLLLLNDLPGTRIDASLASGSEPDRADVRVRVRNDGAAVAGSIRVDNAGLRATGEARADLNVRVRSPLGLGDLLSARYLQSSAGGQTLAALAFGLPVNGYGTRVGLRFAEQRYRLRKEFTPLDASGDQHAVALLLNHPFVRRIDRNLTLAASFSEIDYVDRLGAFGLASDSRHRVATFGATYDSRDKWLGGGTNLLQLQQLGGRALQREPFYAALDTGAGGLNVYGRYSVTRYRVQREQILGERTSVYAAVNGQVASRNLDAGPELALGGPDGVRAYPVGELYADEGYIARVELRRRFALTDASTTALVAFIDQARVRVNHNPLAGDPANRRGLGAYGFGVAHAAGGNLAFQLWFAWRTSESATASPDRSPRVWLAMSAGF